MDLSIVEYQLVHEPIDVHFKCPALQSVYVEWAWVNGILHNLRTRLQPKGGIPTSCTIASVGIFTCSLSAYAKLMVSCSSSSRLFTVPLESKSYRWNILHHESTGFMCCTSILYCMQNCLQQPNCAQHYRVAISDTDFNNSFPLSSGTVDLEPTFMWSLSAEAFLDEFESEVSDSVCSESELLICPWREFCSILSLFGVSIKGMVESWSSVPSWS